MTENKLSQKRKECDELTVTEKKLRNDCYFECLQLMDEIDKDVIHPKDHFVANYLGGEFCIIKNGELPCSTNSLARNFNSLSEEWYPACLEFLRAVKMGDSYVYDLIKTKAYFSRDASGWKLKRNKGSGELELYNGDSGAFTGNTFRMSMDTGLALDIIEEMVAEFERENLF